MPESLRLFSADVFPYPWIKSDRDSIRNSCDVFTFDTDDFLSLWNLGWFLPKYYWLKHSDSCISIIPPPNPGLVKASVQKFSLLASTSSQLILLFLQLVSKCFLMLILSDIIWKVKGNGPNLSHLTLTDCEEGCINFPERYGEEYHIEGTEECLRTEVSRVRSVWKSLGWVSFGSNFDNFWQFWQILTILTMITILTIENLHSWQFLLPDNLEWHWTEFAILAMSFS